MSRACALPPLRDRGRRARPTEGECGREKKKKQAGSAREARRAQFTFTSQDHVLERKFHALSGRVTVGRRLRIFTGTNKRVSSLRFQQLRLSSSKESGVRWGKWRCGCNFFAPPFYVSKWRIGRWGWSSRYLDSRVYPYVQSNSLYINSSLPLFAACARQLQLTDLECYVVFF